MISQLDHLKDQIRMRGDGNGRGQLIAVASGKGGVGKSHLALNLALLSSRHDGPTLLMDGDAGMADLHIMLGVSPDGHWGHFVDGVKNFDEVRCTVRPDLDLIQGFSGVARMDWLQSRASEQVLRAMQNSVGQYNRTWIDVGAGVNPSSMLFTTSADLVLLVINSELTAIADAYGMLKTIRKQNPKQAVAVVVNQASSARQAQKAYADLAQVCEQFLGLRPPYLGFIPQDPKVSAALLRQKPVVEFAPEAPYSNSLLELRLRIEQVLKIVQEKNT